MKLFLIVLMIVGTTNCYSQGNIRDTFNLYTHQYNSGLIAYSKMDSILTSYFSSFPVDAEVEHYEKVFKRNKAFWNDRIYYNDLGEGSSDFYATAMIDYLENPICPNGDDADWNFNFDPSPILVKPAVCTPTGSHGAGIIRAVYMNPSDNSKIVAGAGASGIWYTDNGGTNWKNVTDHLRVPALGIQEIIDISNPSEPEGKHLIAITGKDRFHDSYGIGVLKSSNYGETWSKHSIPEINSKIQYLVDVTKPKGETNNLYACSRDRVYVSSDRGITWALTVQPPIDTIYEEYYSIASSDIVENNFSISTSITRNDGTPHVWKSTVEPVPTSWIDVTTSIMDGVKDYFAVNINDTELASDEYNFLTPVAGFSTIPDGMGGEEIVDYFDLEFEYIYGSTHIKSYPVIFFKATGGGPPVAAHAGYQQKLYYELEHDITIGGDMLVTFDASIPEGARVKLRLGGVQVGEVIGTDGAHGAYSIPVDDYASNNFTDFFELVFAYGPPYDLDAEEPIYIDNIHVELIRSPYEVEPKKFVLAEPNGSESYLLVNTLDPFYGDPSVFGIHTLNSWDDCSLFSREYSHNLGIKRNLAVSYDASDGVYYGGHDFRAFLPEEELFSSTCTRHADVRYIQVIENVDGLDKIIVGDDGGISYSEDSGVTWESLNGDNLPITQFYGIGLNQHDNVSIVGGTQDQGTFYLDDSEWLHIYSGDGGHSGFSPSPLHPNWFYYQSNNGIYVRNSPLIGASVYSFSASSAGLDWFLNEPIEIDPVEGITLYSGHGDKSSDPTYSNGAIVKHDLVLDAFSVFEFDTFGGNVSEIGEIEIAPNNTDFIYTACGENRSSATYEKLFKSEDGGVSYIDISLLASNPETGALYDNDGNPLHLGSDGLYLNDLLNRKNVNAIETNPKNQNKLWIGLSGLNINDGTLVEGRFRVLYSVDGGITWNDYSRGLPPFPINDLIYQEKTNNRLFAATDVGIFYREDGMDEWVCFQEGMPASFATDLEINYCTQELFAGTFGRGIWKTAIDLPDSNPIEITEDLSWGGVQQIENDLIIKDGNTLTLTGTLEMSGNKHIYVEQGAQLIVDGGIITNACNSFWGGIEVWGDKSEIQVPHSNQGKVVLKNNALIENALVGITTWKKDDYNSTGGIILASSSTFKNNKKDVEFRAYQNYNGVGELTGNRSYFANVTFTWDDEFLAEFPLGHVTMYRVDGIVFRGCEFIDARTSPVSAYLDNDLSLRNSGIFSIDAQYYVHPICTDIVGCSGSLIDDPDWKPTTFKNLDFGVYASNVSSERDIIIDRSVFENNFTGTHLVDVNTPIITRSQFTVNDDPTNNFMDTEQYGVHLVRSKGLTVQENEFTHIAGSNTVYGLIFTDLGESEEVVYNNYFKELDFGITAQGKNRGISDIGALEGLQFLCDENVSNEKDHLVLGTLLWVGASPEYGVKEFNGRADNPSGNKFSTLPLDDGHYDNNSANWVNYFYRNGDLPETPENYGGLFNEVAIDFENTCPSRLADNPFQEHTGSNFDSEFSLAATELNNKENTLKSILNGGNKDSLMTEIDNLIVGNRDQLRALLNYHSPYLTVDVVKATVDNPISRYPHAWAYELIVDNIEVAYEIGFIDFLSTKTDPMPTWMIDDIQAELDSGLTTDMTVKKLEIAALTSKKAYAANIILHELKNDTLITPMDSIRHWVNQKGDALAQTRIIDLFIQEGSFTVAQAKVDALELDIQNYPAHLQDELSDFVDFKDKLIAILSSGNDFDNLNEADHSFITDMANTGVGLARYQAQELLCFFYDECVSYAPFNFEGQQNLAPSFDQEREKDEKPSFSVYPNPANDWVTIVLPESDEVLKVTIVDLTGRIVFDQTINRSVFIWDTTPVENGTYLITVTNQTKTESFGTEHLTVQH